MRHTQLVNYGLYQIGWFGPVTVRTYVVSAVILRPAGSMQDGWQRSRECPGRCSRPGVVSATACETLGPSTNWVYD